MILLFQEKIDTEIYFPLPNDMLQIQTTIMKFMSITQDLDLKVATNKLTTDQLYELLIYIVQVKVEKIKSTDLYHSRI